MPRRVTRKRPDPKEPWLSLTLLVRTLLTVVGVTTVVIWFVSTTIHVLKYPLESTVGISREKPTTTNDDTHPSFPNLCHLIRTHLPLHQLWHTTILPNVFSMVLPDKKHMERPDIRDWYVNTFSWNQVFSFSDWKRTILHPPDPTGFQHIMTLVEQHLQYQQQQQSKTTKQAPPLPPPPIRVLVFGGSVTAGEDCQQSYQLGGPLQTTSSKVKNWCAWPHMLQHLANHALGHGVVQIDNLAFPASQSPVSVELMELQLWPHDHKNNTTTTTTTTRDPPHVIVWAHANNDKYFPTEALYRQAIAKFHTTARSLRRRQCQHDGNTDDDSSTSSSSSLPLMIYVNDDGGNGRGRMAATQLTRSGELLNGLVSWFGVMGVAVDRLWLHYALSHDNPTSNHNNPIFALGPNAGGLPLLDMPRGWGFQHHGGLLLHATLAAAVAFNVLSATMDTCVDPTITTPTTTKSTTNKPHQYSLALPKEYIPPLDSVTLKQDIASQWKQDADLAGTSSCQTDQSSAVKCPVVWLSFPGGQVTLANAVTTSDELQRRMHDILVANDGWDSPPRGKHDKLGWNARKAGATFTIQLLSNSNSNNNMAGVRYFRLVVMESYGTGWTGSSLKVTISMDDKKETSTHFISGESQQGKTSPIVPHVLALPGDDGAANDFDHGNITLRFELVGGQAFKILGMGLCR